MAEPTESVGETGPTTNIRGEKVALGPLRRDLLPEYRRWINDFETLRTLGAPPQPMTAEQEESWYESRMKAESEAMFTIYATPDLTPVGNTGLHEIDHRNRSAAFGIVIGESGYRGRGLGTETATLMLDYAFTALGLHNVMLSVYEFNGAGRRAYEKAGFKEIGRRRQCRYMGGRMWDEIFLDCLSPEFESPVLKDIFSAEGNTNRA
ncbi:GNAT family N-acetyltransferase [Rubrobacter aplysinae]|uniref:GNAT family N-acetyltransferase n=1 Tax=Rubrobacter aplysinae TaxID=909625 RepID=UPI00069D8C61|nr:GNAT family protein [Rubrobacter aplysinae]